jgi:hypothetical protein
VEPLIIEQPQPGAPHLVQDFVETVLRAMDEHDQTRTKPFERFERCDFCLVCHQT